jgi:hypothetical protein
MFQNSGFISKIGNSHRDSQNYCPIVNISMEIGNIKGIGAKEIRKKRKKGTEERGE